MHRCSRTSATGSPQRSALGIGRTGGAGENSSGDFALAFSTGNRNAERGPVDFVPNEEIDPLFYATIEATEEAIVNALVERRDDDGAERHRARTASRSAHGSDRFIRTLNSART